MALGKTEICNMALRYIGVRPVNNVESDTSAAAIELKAFWDLAVESTLRLNDWNFATKIIALAEIADEKCLGWDFAYTYPADCIMAWGIETEESVRDKTVTYEWEKLLSPNTSTPVIATNQENAYLRYTSRVIDPSTWDTLFINALTWKLASLVCSRLTSDAGIFQKCSAMYAQAAQEAQTMNRAENNNPTTPIGPYVEVR